MLVRYDLQENLKSLYERTGIDIRPLFYGLSEEEALRRDRALDLIRRREKSMSAWTCHLMQSSPRYEKWREILGSDVAPILSPTPVKAIFGAELVPIYRLNIAKLNADQKDKLIAFIMEKFKATRAEAVAEIETTGFPIRIEDVSVCFDMRYF